MIKNKEIKLLIIEDQSYDEELIIRRLRKADIQFNYKRVETEDSFINEVNEFNPDIIISDFRLPSFDGISALNIAREICPDIPFIIVSGTIGEEKLIEIMKSGATDYVSKDRLEKLVPSFQRALLDAENKLEKLNSQANLFALIENTDSAIWSINTNYELLTFNSVYKRTFEKFYKFEPKEGIKINEILTENAKKRWMEFYNRALHGENFTVQDSYNLDQTKIFNETSFFPIISKNTVTGVSLYSRDITEKKEIESHLFRAQRLESLGSLANGIAHDLNNILAPILMATEILKNKITDDKCQRILSTLETSAKRGADIIKQILTFSGVAQTYDAININNITKDIEKIIRETFPKSIVTEMHVPPECWEILGDQIQLYQVVLNLCVNARDAMPDGGQLLITAENIVIDKNFSLMDQKVEEGKYLLIRISDTGEGIPAENLNKIFDSFFTTKEPGKGTGIGLSTVATIVKNHKGFISVDSIMGKGTTFTLYLPAAESIENKKTEQDVSELQLGTGELILVVDDEAAIRDITREILEVHDYKVLVAGDGAEAISLYAQYNNKIKVVIMDMCMPIMDGLATVKVLKKLDSDIKLIVVGGLSDKQKFSKELSDHFLEKPYTSDMLLKLISEVLKTTSINN